MVAELASIDQLLFEFAGPRMSVPVKVGVPADRPAEFLRVERLGGGPDNRALDKPLVMGQGWAQSRARAEDIAAEFRDLLMNRYGEAHLIRGVLDVNGPYFDPDPDSYTPRFTVTATLSVRAR